MDFIGMETERQTAGRNRVFWHGMRDQFDQQAAFFGRQFNGGRTIGINMAVIAYNVRFKPADAFITTQKAFANRAAPALPAMTRRLFEPRAAVNRRTAARQLGSAFGAFLRLAFIALFQHAASPSGAAPKKNCACFCKRPVRHTRNYFGGPWRTSV